MRKSAIATTLYAALLIQTGGCSDASDIDEGKAALETRCARCHAIGLTDVSAHKEAPPFREVVLRYPPENLAESLAEGIVSGHPDMPQFVLAPNEIANVIEYLSSLLPEKKG
jgi:mono/diheme cytochrome c family protein